MASPYTTVTFIDAEGDEFPVRVWGTFTTGERRELMAAARSRLDEFVAAGELRPTEPVREERIEGLWQV